MLHVIKWLLFTAYTWVQVQGVRRPVFTATWFYVLAIGPVLVIRGLSYLLPVGPIIKGFMRHFFWFLTPGGWVQWFRALRALDTLPTVQRGKAAIGMDTVAQWNVLIARDPADLGTPYPNFARRPSPYTHPLQVPPAYIPGVPAQMFYNPADFPWAQELEAATPIIQAELKALLADPSNRHFRTYITEFGLKLNYWNTYNLFASGKKIEANCARCPQTVRILENLPRFERDHIMFSALAPGARLAPHTGPTNGILRAHLPLVVPRQAERCTMTVGSETRHWEPGKLMIFDDAFTHYAHNDTDDIRIVLFINFWHPVFSEAELPTLLAYRQALQATTLARAWFEQQLRPQHEEPFA